MGQRRAETIESVEEIQFAIDFAQRHGVWWGAAMLLVGAMIEYVVPPFPGDSITIAGAMLIPTAGWNPVIVFAAVMAGSMLGGAIDWRVGIWLADRLESGDDNRLVRWLHRPSVQKRYDWVVDKFDRHGAKFLAVNRFLPVFRSFFFIAAGLARLSLRSVLLWSALSAAVWNGALLAVGYAVGYNIEQLAWIVERYTIAVLAGLVALFVVVQIVKRVGRSKASVPS